MGNQTVILVSTDDTEGFFDRDARPTDLASHGVSVLLKSLSQYSSAAGLWNNVTGTKMSLEQAPNNTGPGVIIKGYWDTVPDGVRARGKTECPTSVACTKGTDASKYPVLSQNQELYIEEPPHWPNKEHRETWTLNFIQAMQRSDEFEYLPWILFHEFGHVLGLSDTPGSTNSIMGGQVRDLYPPCSGEATSKGLCGISDYDRNGIRAIYLANEYP